MSNADLFGIKVNEKYGFINEQGDIVIEPSYKEVNNFREGLAYVWTFDNKKGYINTENEWVIELNADYLGDFEHGLAMIYHKGKYGCINKQGDFEIELIYDRIEDKLKMEDRKQLIEVVLERSPCFESLC